MSPITAQADPNVRIPTHVAAAAARAEEIYRQAYPTTEPAADPAPAPPEAAADPAPAPAEAAPAPAPQEVTPASNESVDWERRYSSMKGRFDQATQQLRIQGEQITNLNSLVASLQAPTVSAPVELQAARLITPEEEQEYGSEFLGVVGKRAKEVLSAETAELLKEINVLKSQIGNVQGFVSQRAADNLEATLDQRCPNWRDINTNPDFISWLSLPETFSGIIRHELLKDAWERKDAHRVAVFFNGFLSEEAVVSPANGPHPGDVTSTKIPLENFAAPGRAKTAAAGMAPAEKPSFTRAQIASFYADVAASKYRGREADKNRIEAQIFDAQRDGRISNT